MIRTLALRHLLVRRARSAFLLLGFAVGVGTMIVLLSVGEAMLVQSRDVSLVGGGEVTVLPQGVDLEALRTGALTGMFFGVDRARFVTRQALGGERTGDMVASVAPVLEGKLVYIAARGRTVAARAGAELPGRAALAGTPLRVLEGTWRDSPADSAWVAPSSQQLYDELDRWHRPAGRDSSWGEWQYFNIVSGPEEWWYITYLVGGDIRGGRWGGRLLVTHRMPGGRYEQFTASAEPDAIAFDTRRADLRLGGSGISQRSGLYFLDGIAQGDRGTLRFRLTLRPGRHRFFPAVELRSDEFVSGYVVPALRAEVSGDVCIEGECVVIDRAPAYHDHNWGVWQDVTWEWGAARGTSLDFLYGGVTRTGTVSGESNPYFFAVVDSLGLRQVLRFGEVAYEGRRPVPGTPVEVPDAFTLTAARGADTVRLRVTVTSVNATAVAAAGLGRWFLQMRGVFTASGRIGGLAVADSGSGFFETHR